MTQGSESRRSVGDEARKLDHPTPQLLEINRDFRVNISSNDIDL
jgi:hypothetical protein